MTQLPDTPAGRQAAWFVRHKQTRCNDLTDADVEEHMPGGSGPQGHFHQVDERPWTVTGFVEASPWEIEVRVDHDDDRPSGVRVVVDADPPHAITWLWVGRAMPDGARVREATDADAAALNDLEIRAPMTLGDGTVLTLDRGSDFLAFGRLMDENVTFVAERDGELLGMACGAAHDTRIGGTVHRVMLLHRIRVPVEHRKGGVFSTLNGHVFGRYDGRSDAPYGFTFVENPEAVRIGGPDAWSIPVYRAVIDCAAVAQAGAGRVATPDDASVIIDTLNRCHDGEENYLPYTVASLTQRLERAPDLYSWDDVRIGEDAVLGVWPSGMVVTTTRGDDVGRATRAVVLDHGFGDEDGFDALVRSWCAELVERGHDELTMIISKPSPGWRVVSGLTDHIDHYSFRMGVAEPQGTADRGIYVDAVYF